MATKQMTISPRFFKKEKDNYGDWSFAFWRELFQNAIDEGCRDIQIRIQQEDGGDRAWVEFEDNGRGMSAETRDDVYFRLGETTKDGLDTIGGFGKARLVTCFAHHQYELWSREWYAIGQGSGYDVQDSSPWVKGLKLRILVDATDRYGYSVDMLKKLRTYLAMSQLDCNVTINDKERWTGWCYKRRFAKSLSFGDVHVNKSGNYEGFLIVRLKGAPMFYRSIAADAQVVIEIDPGKWRHVLVSNRDDLLSDPNDELNRFIQAIAVDKTSALRESRRKTLTVYGGNPRVTSRTRPPASRSLEAEPPTGQRDAAKTSQPVPGTELPRKGLERGIDRSEITTDREQQIRDEILNAAIVMVETDNANMLKVVNSYRPENWQLVEWDKRPGSPYMKGRHKRDLLRLWTIACDAVISCWLDFQNMDNLSWIPGFLFSDDSQAQHHTRDDGSHALLFVPVKADGKMRFRLRSQDDWCQLIMDACHEVVHTRFSPHDEPYANCLTDLAARAMAKKNRIFRRFREALKKD